MRTGKTYQLGDTIKIKVVKANLVAKQLDFKVVD
jgi:ribonuclease R